MTSPKQKGMNVMDLNHTHEQNVPPWPEWSDNYVSNIPGTGKPAKRSMNISNARRSSPSEEEFFEDPAGLSQLPSDILVESWLRPFQIDPTINFVLEPDGTPLDLVSNNRHLIEYKIMRMIIASVMSLEREAFHRPFPIEFQTVQFVARRDTEWKPWHHVYSSTSVAKDKPHTIQYNRYGKYLVRLFYLGKWRRILVDDQIPVSKDGHILLPMSRPDNLWLPVLSKALLRVAALSWVAGNHAVDFSIIHCLTGWIPTSVPCQNYTENQLWCVCCQLMKSTEEIVKSPGCCVGDQGFNCPPDDSMIGLPADESRAIFGIIIHPVLHRPRMEFAMSVSNLEYIVLISNVRYTKPNPLWKEYRWKKWASRKGIYSDITHEAIRNVQIFNSLDISSLPSNNQVNGVVEHEYWMDFASLVPFTRYLEVYYKPSYFKYKLRASVLSELLLNPHCADNVHIRKESQKEVTGKSKGKGSKGKTEKTEKSMSISLGKGAKISKGSSKSKSEKIKSPNMQDNRFLAIDTATKLHTASFFYLLIDSMECKQLYICLSAYDGSKPTYAHIVVGKFEWYSPTVAPIIFMISTSGTKGYMVTLSPGLHVFRIWHDFPSHFYLQICSNTTFIIGTKMSIQHELTFDSVSYKFYGNEISSSFEQLLDSPEGGVEHGKAYDKFMTSLQPPQLTKQLLWPHWLNAYLNLQQAFEESLTQMLVDLIHFPEEIYQTLRSYKMLFLNPAFGDKALRNKHNDIYEYIEERRQSERMKQILLEEELKEKLTRTSTQKGKGKSPKSDKSSKIKPGGSEKATAASTKTGKKMDEKKGKKKSVTLGQKLRTLLVCKEKNLLLNDSNHAIALLKMMLTKAPHLRQYYPFRFEDGHRVVHQDYVGELHVKADTLDNWVVLVRCVLNIHSSESVPCSLHFWSPMDKFVVRLINNDTHQNVPLGFVENNVAYLSKNQEGYTLCVHGIATSQAEAWRLRSIGIKEGDLLHICHGYSCQNNVTQLPEQTQRSLLGYYIPNKDRLIARCLLKVFSDVTVLLRFQLSEDSVFCSFSIYDDKDNFIENITGIGHIIIPILKLKGKYQAYRGSSEGSRLSSLQVNIYKVEVKVLNNSWPLNENQIKAMLYYKEHLPDFNMKRDEGSNNTIHDSPLPETIFEDIDYTFFETIDKPTWCLTVVADSHKFMSVKLCEDTSLYDHLEQLKIQWKEEGTDLSLCHNLRQDFLNKSFEREEKDWSEKTVFHLYAKKTDALTNLYAEQVAPISGAGESSSNLVECCLNTSLITSPISSLPSHYSTVPSVHSSHASQQPSLSSVVSCILGEEASSSNVKIDHKNVLVQQAGIHKALEDMRTKNMEYLKQLFEETADMRAQLIERIKLAKEEELKREKVNTVTPKSKKSILKSPDKKKKNP